MSTPPKSYAQWRTDEVGREEDAANLFGHFLVLHCRNKALASVGRKATAETRAAVQHAVDEALHNVMDLLEGYWPLPAGEGYSAELALHVNIVRNDEPVESVAISPSRLDLPIGYWSWVET